MIKDDTCQDEPLDDDSSDGNSKTQPQELQQ